MERFHHIPAEYEWLAEHMRQVESLLHVLVAQGEFQARRMERLLKLLENPDVFPQATDARVDQVPAGIGFKADPATD